MRRILILVLFTIILSDFTFSQNIKINIDSLFSKGDTCKYTETRSNKVIQQTLIRLNDTLCKRIYYDYSGFKKFEGTVIYKNENIDTKYGKWTGELADGTREERNYNSAGILDGELCEFDINGNRVSRVMFKDGNVNGPKYGFYSDGVIQFISYFKYEYYEMDQLRSVFVDTSRVYYHNGQLMMYIIQKDGHRKYVKTCDSTGTDCTERFFDKNGKTSSLKKNGVKIEDEPTKKADTNKVEVKGLSFYIPTGARIYLKGLALGIFTHFAEVKGFSLSIIDINETIKGVSMSLILSSIRTCKGVQIGMFNGTYDMHGVQIGIINQASVLNGVQIGLLNLRGDFSMDLYGIRVEDSPCYPTPLINFGWTNNRKEK